MVRESLFSLVDWDLPNAIKHSKAAVINGQASNEEALTVDEMKKFRQQVKFSNNKKKLQQPKESYADSTETQLW